MNQSESEHTSQDQQILSFKQIPTSSYKIFFICLIGVTFANLDHSIFILVSEKFQNEFGWALTDVGWYVAITFFISGIICTQVGVLTDRIGRKKSLLSCNRPKLREIYKYFYCTLMICGGAQLSSKIDGDF